MVFKVLATATAILLATAGQVAARSVPLLIGAYTGGTNKGITLYRFDDRTGQISAVPVQVMPSENPSWLVLSADHRRLYAVNENGDGRRDPVGRVTAWRIDPATGRMALLNRVSSLGADPTYASLSRDGRYLFVANYSGSADPGGTLAVVPVAADGTLRPVTQTVRQTRLQ